MATFLKWFYFYERCLLPQKSGFLNYCTYYKNITLRICTNTLLWSANLLYFYFYQSYHHKTLEMIFLTFDFLIKDPGRSLTLNDSPSLADLFHIELLDQSLRRWRRIESKCCCIMASWPLLTYFGWKINMSHYLSPF